MRCSKCGSDNRPGRKFCAECGTSLAAKCPKCGAVNEPNEKFCGECGAALTRSAEPAIDQYVPTLRDEPSIRVTSEPANAEAETSAHVDGERKMVTALFADIKGSTELIERLDPEEARTIVDPALRIMVEAVRRYDGYVVQSTGDGIFVLFGAPAAHEDHPQRALYAALRMQEDLRGYSARVVSEGGTPVQSRVGVNTGEVVVRGLETGQGHAEYAPIGHSVNLAARMQTAAPVGSIAATETTRKLCEGFFTFKLLGPTLVKGVSEPVNVWEVTGLGLLRNRLQRAASRGLTRFVGREREMEALRHAAGLAGAGHGQVVAAMAEPGVGKSRLYHEFKLISQSEWLIFEAVAVSHGKASSYLPVIELLKDYFEIGMGDDERKRREKVNGKIVTLDRSLEDTLPYLFTLLGLNSGDDPLAQMDPQIKRRRTHEAVKRILRRESVDRPLMLIFEDLHWIDAETQGLLNVLVDSIANARILLLVNYRPEYRHEWGNRTYYLQLRLDPLGQESADEMLLSLLGNEVELAPLRRLISEKTEGNPFFIEEIVVALFDDSSLVRNGRLTLTRPLTQIKVPTTVHAVLASRIDRLAPDEKDLLQTLAVLGREFTLELVRNVVGMPADELERLLSRLQLSEFIYEQPAFPHIEYLFKHALTQEVAYSSVLSERRKSLHDRAGAALEALYANRLEDHLSELARHYERSGNAEKAVEYLQRAGQQSASRASQAAAITLFGSALELINTLPETPERLKKELTPQLGLGSALQPVKGFSTPEVGQTFSRAFELCQQIEGMPELFQVILGLTNFYYMRLELSRAHELAEHLVAISERDGNPVSLIAAHMTRGVGLLTQGNFTLARDHFERAASLVSSAHRSIYGPAALCWHGAILGYLGYPDEALDKNCAALTLARELSDPFTYINALHSAQLVHQLRGEWEASLALADDTLRLSTENGFQQYSAFAMSYRGRALTQLNHAEEGIAALRQGIRAMRSSGMHLLTLSYAVLAEGYAKAGSTADGLSVAAEGLESSDRTGDLGWKAELYRIRGDLLLIEGKPASVNEAKACFRQAIEIARHQQAKWWELRATVSLARWLAKQDRLDEARTMLTDVYNWFTEGFETADLKDAKSLLDELSN
jgi:class 3 adenylate cyclase/tetratricopeptide (TPR) repeat protein